MENWRKFENHIYTTVKRRVAVEMVVEVQQPITRRSIHVTPVLMRDEI